MDVPLGGFLSVFSRLAHLALQNVKKDYVIFSYFSKLRRQKWPKTKNQKWDEQNIWIIFSLKIKTKFLFPVEALGGMPTFIGQLQNVTVSEGRDATFTCSVTNLGGHKVMIPTEYFQNIQCFWNTTVPNNIYGLWGDFST